MTNERSHVTICVFIDVHDFVRAYASVLGMDCASVSASEK